MSARLCRGLNCPGTRKAAAVGCRNMNPKQCVKPGSGGTTPSSCSRTTLNNVEHWEFGQFQRSVASVQAELGTGTLFRDELHGHGGSTHMVTLNNFCSHTLAHAPSATRLPKWEERYLCDQKMAAKSIYLGFCATLASHSWQHCILNLHVAAARRQQSNFLLTELNHPVQRMSACLQVCLKLSPLACCHS